MLGVLIVYTLIVLYFAALPAEKIGNPTITQNSKLLHVLEFAGFIVIATVTCLAGIDHLSFIKINIYGVLLAAITELMQLISPGRTCSFRNVLFDLLGITLGWVLLLTLFAALLFFITFIIYILERT